MSWAVRKTGAATREDLDGLPDGVRGEILDGEVIVSPRPLARSGRAQAGIGRFVGGPFDFDPGGPGGWWIVVEPEVELSRHQVFVPDLAGWRRTTLPSLPSSRPLSVRPDWACEILSPSTERFDRVRKADVYLESGVGHYWLVDVERRVLEAWEAAAGRWSRFGAFGDGDIARIAPFDAVEIDVGRLFPPEPPAAG